MHRDRALDRSRPRRQWQTLLTGYTIVSKDAKVHLS